MRKEEAVEVFYPALNPHSILTRQAVYEGAAMPIGRNTGKVKVEVEEGSVECDKDLEANELRCVVVWQTMGY